MSSYANLAFTTGLAEDHESKMVNRPCEATWYSNQATLENRDNHIPYFDNIVIWCVRKPSTNNAKKNIRQCVVLLGSIRFTLLV